MAIVLAALHSGISQRVCSFHVSQWQYTKFLKNIWLGTRKVEKMQKILTTLYCRDVQDKQDNTIKSVILLNTLDLHPNHPEYPCNLWLYVLKDADISFVNIFLLFFHFFMFLSAPVRYLSDISVILVSGSTDLLMSWQIRRGVAPTTVQVVGAF